MKLYRISTNREIQCLKNGEISEVGANYNPNNDNNSFCYDKDKKYLHFFKDQANFKYILNYADSRVMYYLETWEIPDEVVLANKGTGYYYILDNQFKVEEYAISIDELNINYLENIEYFFMDDLNIKR